MNFDVQKATIFESVHGSHSYGLNTETSDIDIKGFCIPPKEFILGFSLGFEQKDRWEQLPETRKEILKGPFGQQILDDPPKDKVIYSLAKFMKLAVACNPSVIEILFTEPRFQLICHPLAEKILAVRDSLISQKAYQTFHGYAFSQLKRIKLHRRWLLNPPDHQPTRSEFGLPEEQKILDSTTNGAFNRLFADMLEASGFLHEREDFIGSYMNSEDPLFQDWLANVQAISDRKPELLRLHEETVSNALGLKRDLMEVVVREKEYSKALHDWKQYTSWKKNRNEDRSKLESQFGYDTKHGMHLVRLLKMGKEILTGKGVQVFRKDDREELLSIRQGAWSYEQLEEYADQERADLKEAAKNSSIPKTPNVNRLNKLCVEICEEFWSL